MKDLFKKFVISILIFEAKLVLKKYKPRIIAITGSVGKTSTKDALYTVLQKSFSVRKSEKSFNSEFGVPLTILDCPTGWNNPFLWIKNIIKGFYLIVLTHPYPEWLVLEVGADRPGDIEKMSKWLSTDIVIITRFGDKPVHVEFFTSTEHLVAEKAFLIDSLKKDGLLLLNADDERVLGLSIRTEGEIVTYGFSEQADIRALEVRNTYKDNLPTGLTLDFLYQDDGGAIHLKNVIGKHHIYPALCSIVVGLRLGMKMEDVATAAADYLPPPGRLRLIQGVKKTLIIDDSYNSSPVALLAGLETLASLEVKGRRIAILGDMLELGSLAVEAHREVGVVAGTVCDFLFVVGPRSKYFVEGALTGGMSEKNIVEFTDSRDAGKHAEGILEEGDVVFVKGSQRVRMEKAAEEIMEHPENKYTLLPRQDPEWEVR